MKGLRPCASVQCPTVGARSSISTALAVKSLQLLQVMTLECASTHAC